MFGQNPVRHADNFPKGRFRVQSIFYTIQGEGPFAGIPAVFIRLAGCNLRCWFCDTDFESGWNNIMTPEAMHNLTVELSRGKRQPLVVLTGGEPFLQDLECLLDYFCSLGFHVQIETAGTLWNAYVAQRVNFSMSPSPGLVSLVVSPKTPVLNKMASTFALAFKYIVAENVESDPEDGLPLNLARPRAGSLVYVQPMDVPDPIQKEKNVQRAVEISMTHGHRLSLQMHKIVGVD